MISITIVRWPKLKATPRILKKPERQKCFYQRLRRNRFMRKLKVANLVTLSHLNKQSQLLFLLYCSCWLSSLSSTFCHSKNTRELLPAELFLFIFTEMQQQPTSDFEEEWSEQEESGGVGAQRRHLLELALSVQGIALPPIRLLISRQGILKIPTVGSGENHEEDQYIGLRKTILPILVGGSKQESEPADSSGGGGGAEKQNNIGDLDDTELKGLKTPPQLQSAVSVTSDLPASPPTNSLTNSGGPSSPHGVQEGWQTEGESSSSLLLRLSAVRQRSLSPVYLAYSGGPRPALRRQNTFVEASCQTSAAKLAAADSKSAQTEQPLFKVQLSQTEVSAPAPVVQGCQTDLAVVHQVTQTEETYKGEPSGDTREPDTLLSSAKESISRRKHPSGQESNEDRDQSSQEDVLRKPSQALVVELGMQTIPVLVVQSMVQTDPMPASMEYLVDELPVLARTPCRELTFGSTQTESLSLEAPSPGCQAREVQTSPRSTVSGSSSAGSHRNHTFVLDSRSSLIDEIVARVLLEHADFAEENHYYSHLVDGDHETDRIVNSSADAKHNSESEPGATRDERSPSFVSAQSWGRSYSHTVGAIKSWTDLVRQPIDLSRSVNYLDLSRLGNEGETPNSDEIWVNVEDDNKFLTSDTETYSVATDKVSAMATFKGHLIGGRGGGAGGGSVCDPTATLLNSASETELAELGNESYLSDLEVGEEEEGGGRGAAGGFSSRQVAALLHHEIRPVRELLTSTGQTVAGIADTLYNIQDGINNICCNVTQMKCKVLSSGETENSVFNDASYPEEEKLELLKNGHPVGDTDELVDMVMTKLESALRRRDDQLQSAISSLQEDNLHLRKEVEYYRDRATTEGYQRNNELEVKMHEVLDHMNTLRSKTHINGMEPFSSATSSDVSHSAESKTRRLKRRSRSKPVSNQDKLLMIDPNLTEKPFSGSNRKFSHQDVMTSSSDEEMGKMYKSNNKLQLMKDSSTARTFDIVKPDCVSTAESEQQTTAQAVETKEIQTDLGQEFFDASTSTDDFHKTNNLDIAGTPPLDPQLKTGAGKSENSDLKVNFNTPTKRRLKKSETLEEVTDSITFVGRGSGMEGGMTPLPNTLEEALSVNTEVLGLNNNKNTEPDKINKNIKVKDKGKNAKEKDKSMKSKSNVKASIIPKRNSLAENIAIKELPVASKKEVQKTNEKKKDTKKSATNAVLNNTSVVHDSATISKVIEGDDFKITITSNQELISCELSDTEGNSPRKKIIVTPKTPDKKKIDQIVEQTEEVAVKGGRKIPISKTYIKAKNKIPAPEQFPVARPPTDHIPTPSIKYASAGVTSAIRSSMSPSYPISYDMAGYNHNLPPTPTHQDYSICSNTYPISGRNTQMSFDGGDVITMMIKQDSRDSCLYDAPNSIPDIMDFRESPDGAYSYVIDGRIRSSMSNISDLKPDYEEEISDVFERDILMEFVHMDEAIDQQTFRSSNPSPFKKYLNQIKHKVIKEHIDRGREKRLSSRFLKQGNEEEEILEVECRPPVKPIAVRRGGQEVARQRLRRTRSMSLSTEKLQQTSKTQMANRKLLESRRKCVSTDRLVGMTPSEEERIIRIKKYEDDTEQQNESRRHYNMRRGHRHKKIFQHQKSCLDNGVIIYESERPKTVLEQNENFRDDENKLSSPECVQKSLEDSGLESQGSRDYSSDNQTSEQLSSGGSGQETKNEPGPHRQGSGGRCTDLGPMNQAEKQKVSSLSHAPLTVECFIVSRGWQVDQAQLTKALAKLDGVNFVRIQVANTMNRVLENIRPNNDVVLIHIGTQEISEACRSINSDDSIPGREISLFYNTVKANKKLEKK
jgi:hypothetical protein